MLICFLCHHEQLYHLLGGACRIYGCPCTEFVPCVESGQIWECREEVRVHRDGEDWEGHIFYPGDRIITDHPDPIDHRPFWIINFFGTSYQTQVDILYNYFQLV